jgi:DNA polymerase-3 subunit epsilon
MSKLVIKNPNRPKVLYQVMSLPETFVVFDFETTGLNPVNDRIVEIGAVRFTRGEPVAMFNCMVWQDPILHPMDAKMTEITGHTAEDISKGIDEQDAVSMLLVFMRQGILPTTLVGQNILFDYSFLERACARYGIDLMGQCHDLLDTLTIARDRKPYPHRLPNLCEHWGVEQGQWHSAYQDAMATGDVLLAMHAEDADYAPDKQAMAYKNVIGYRPKYGEPEWYPHWTEIRPQGNTTVKEGVQSPLPNKKLAEQVASKVNEILDEDIPF